VCLNDLSIDWTNGKISDQYFKTNDRFRLQGSYQFVGLILDVEDQKLIAYFALTASTLRSTGFCPSLKSLSSLKTQSTYG
jgi:hypothetical protein